MIEQGPRTTIMDWAYQDIELVGLYLKWNSYLSDRHKLFYVATPKVACTAIKWWFSNIEGVDQLILQDMTSQESTVDLSIHDTFYKAAPKVTGLDLDELNYPLFSDEYFRFAVVRNPYTRIFSAWQSKLLLQEPLQIGPYLNSDFYQYSIKTAADIAVGFEIFLEHVIANEAPSFWDLHWTPQVDLIRPDLISYSCMAKIEESEILSKELASRLDPSIPSPFQGQRSNESLIPFIADFITERSAELVKTLYARDFEAFGYDKEPPFARTVYTLTQCNDAIKAIHMIRARHQRIGEQNKLIKEGIQEITEGDGQILSLHKTLAARDGQILSLNQALAARDGQILSLNQALADRDGQITTLERMIKDIIGSTSWCVTKPLRWVGQRIKTRKLVIQQHMKKSIGRLRGKPKTNPTDQRCRPKILFVSHDASRTGAPVLLLKLANLIQQELKIECSFLLCGGGVLENEFNKLGPCSILHDRHVVPKETLSDLKGQNIRLVYSNTATNGLIQRQLKNLGCPILCHVHELGFSLEHYFGGDNIEAVKQYTDFFLAGSHAVADYLTSQLRIPPNKVEVAHPFVDAEANCSMAAKFNTSPLSYPSDTIVVGACGNIGWRKGTDLFIQVARRVLDRMGRRVQFVWIGGPLDHGDYPNLQYDIKTLNISDSLTFVGEVKSHLSYFKRFDIFVLPSREDPFPLVVLDAASLGLPVVCFDKSGGTTELVEKDAGLVAPYLDVESMAESIIQLAENSLLRRQLGNRARAKVYTQYDIHVAGLNIANIVQSHLNSSE